MLYLGTVICIIFSEPSLFFLSDFFSALGWGCSGVLSV